MKEIEFDAIIKRTDDSHGGSFIEFPYDVRSTFGKNGRIKVLSYFDNIEYQT